MILRTFEALLEKILNVFEVTFQFLATALLAIMLVTNTANITLRTVFDYSFAWVWPWTMVLFVWFIFLSFYLLYRQRRDVSIAILYDRLGARMQNVLGVLVYCLMIAVSVVLIATIPGLMFKQMGYIEITNLPRYFLSIPFLASSILIVLDAIHNIVKLALGSTAYKPYGATET